MNHETARAIVQPFYDALTRPAEKDVARLVTGAALPTWASIAGAGSQKTREQFIAQVVGFGQLIPDLAWTIEEVLVDGDRIIVRSTASGTPARDFMGVPHGGKRFSIMTIDIHTTVEGKLAVAHHVEDWASALRQLSST